MCLDSTQKHVPGDGHLATPYRREIVYSVASYHVLDTATFHFLPNGIMRFVSLTFNLEHRKIGARTPIPGRGTLPVEPANSTFAPVSGFFIFFFYFGEPAFCSSTPFRPSMLPCLLDHSIQSQQGPLHAEKAVGYR